jgi:hypothetical protein
MTEQEYAELCATCDRLLHGPGTSLNRVAIPLLHVINEHPTGLRQYAPALRGAIQDSLPGSFRRHSRALGRVGRALLRATGPRAAPAQSGQPDARPKVLIVSHLSSPGQLVAADDFYFGALQQQLHDRGASSVLILVDHLRDAAARHACNARLLPGTRHLLPQRVSTAVEAQIWRQCIKSAQGLRREALQPNSALERALAILASQQALMAGAVANLRLHASIRELCWRLLPDIVITTYEGDASERMVWHAARAVPRPPLCVGYQHTRLMRRSHAIRHRLGPHLPACDPDVILTLGQSSQATLASSPQLHSTRLITYGSHRRAAARQNPELAQRPNGCLVLPDADESECAILFGFAAECARRCPSIEFVFRPHPITDFMALRTRQSVLHTLPHNVTVSSFGNLEQDCLRARYCLYRGSSAVIHAVLLGLKPFYVAGPGELSLDPLFELNDWRETVQSPQQFQLRVELARDLPDPAGAQRAWEYCDRYVAAVQPEAIDELLRLVASPGRKLTRGAS